MLVDQDISGEEGEQHQRPCRPNFAQRPRRNSATVSVQTGDQIPAAIAALPIRGVDQMFAGMQSRAWVLNIIAKLGR
jgi:hypothetical protein